VQLPVLGPPGAKFTVEEVLREQMEEFEARSLASNTVRGYASDWKDFVAWCETQGRKSLPADVDTAFLYFVDCAQRLTKATLNRRIAAISRKHRDAGHTSPTGEGKFRQVMAGVRRRRTEPQVAKRPLLAADLFEILAQRTVARHRASAIALCWWSVSPVYVRPTTRLTRRVVQI
jgi:site-specific recombinase XerD